MPEKIDFVLTSKDRKQYVHQGVLFDLLLRYRDYPQAENYSLGQPVSIQDPDGTWIGQVAEVTRRGILIDVT